MFLHTSGILEGDYCIVIVCRDGSTCAVKNGELLANVNMDVDYPAVGLIKVDKNYIIGCRNKAAHAVQLKVSEKFKKLNFL